jgi:hypothetical protein
LSIDHFKRFGTDADLSPEWLIQIGHEVNHDTWKPSDHHGHSRNTYSGSSCEKKTSHCDVEETSVKTSHKGAGRPNAKHFPRGAWAVSPFLSQAFNPYS